MENNLDRILSGDEDIVSSSDFVSKVMVAVHREASTPSPIPFPWWRVMPGLAICVAALTSLIVIAVIQFRGGSAITGPIPLVFVNVVEVAKRVGLGWVSLAFIASLVPTKLALARV